MNMDNIIRMFNFSNMFLIIMVLVLVIVGILFFMGPVGRFFFKMRLPGPRTVLLAQTHTNELKFFRVKSDGLNLKWGRHKFMFLPDLSRKGGENSKEFNEITKKPAHVDGYPVYLGAISASVACNPHLMNAITTAQKGSEALGGFFKSLEKTFNYEDVDGEKKLLNKPRVKNIHLLNHFNIKDLAEIINMVITPQRLTAVYTEGELAGINRHKPREAVLLGVIIVLVIGLLAQQWMMGR